MKTFGYLKHQLISVAVPDEQEEKEERKYTRDGVARMLCWYCEHNVNRFYSSVRKVYIHASTATQSITCLASDWLIKTEGKE